MPTFSLKHAFQDFGWQSDGNNSLYGICGGTVTLPTADWLFYLEGGTFLSIYSPIHRNMSVSSWYSKSLWLCPNSEAFSFEGCRLQKSVKAHS